MTSIDRHVPDWADAPVTFTINDYVGVKFPHSDALVISTNIAEAEVRRILVDGGSSVDLLFVHAFDQLRIPRSRHSPSSRPLQGFNGAPLNAL